MLSRAIAAQTGAVPVAVSAGGAGGVGGAGRVLAGVADSGWPGATRRRGAVAVGPRALGGGGGGDARKMAAFRAWSRSERWMEVPGLGSGRPSAFHSRRFCRSSASDSPEESLPKSSLASARLSISNC